VGGLDTKYNVYYKIADRDVYSKEEVLGQNFFYFYELDNDVAITVKVAVDTYQENFEKPVIYAMSDPVTVTPNAKGTKKLMPPDLSRPDNDYEVNGHRAIHLKWNLYDYFDNGNGQDRIINTPDGPKTWKKNTAVDYFYIVLDGEKVLDSKGNLLKIQQNSFETEYMWYLIKELDYGSTIPWYYWIYDIPLDDDDEYAHSCYIVPVAPDGTEGVSSDQVIYNEYYEDYSVRPFREKKEEGTFYNISFDGNGGFAQTPLKKVKNGGTYGSLPSAYKSGYRMSGWFTAANGGTKITSDSVVNLTSDQTLYAHWESEMLQVTLNAMGGTVSPAKMDVIKGESYGELPTPVNSGKRFAGWYTSGTGGSLVTSDTIVESNENHTLYARWLQIIKVTFSMGQYEYVYPSYIEVVNSQPYGTLPTPYKEGYNFVGWYLEKEGAAPVEIRANTIVTETADHNLVPHWNNGEAMVDSFSLSFDTGRIGLNYYIKNLDSNVINAGKIVINGNDYSIPVAEKDGTYKFSYYVTAKEMNKQISISVFDGAGNKVSLSNDTAVDGVVSHSVRDYLNMAKNDDKQKLADLAKAVDAFGLYAQKYFAYDIPSTLPSVSDTPATLVNERYTTSGSLPKGVRYLGSSLVLNDSVSIRTYFSVDGDVSGYTFSVDGKNYTPIKKDNLYYIEKSDINATNLGTKHAFSVQKGSDKYTINYSALSYIYTAVNTSQNDLLVKLSRSLYWYHVKVSAYLGQS